ARKSAGCRVEERIAVGFVADPEVVAAIEQFRETVMAETLCDDLSQNAAIGMSDAVEPSSVEGAGGGVSGGVCLVQITVGGHSVRIGLERRG
ncbi:MAG: hypothetical protein ACKOCK_07145, partial [Chloroflexota bacterium]